MWAKRVNEWITFDEFIQTIKPGDEFYMKSVTTPGLDPREGYLAKCVGIPCETYDVIHHETRKTIAVLYPRGVAFYSGQLGALHDNTSVGVRFKIVD